MSRRAVLGIAVMTAFTQLPEAAGDALPLVPRAATRTGAKAAPVTVKAPSVAVKRPAVAVKRPAVAVKQPSVPVKPPAVAVKVPAAKVPSTPVKPPVVTAAPGAGGLTTPSTTVTAPLPSAPVTVTTPPVTVKTPPTPAVKIPAPRAAPTAPPGPTVLAPVTGSSAPVTKVRTAVLRATGGTARSRPASGGAGTAADTAVAASVTAPLLPVAQTLIAPAGPRTSAPAIAADPRLARLLAHGRATLNDRRVRGLVRRLAACLAYLPPRMRKVLRLRSGAHEKRPLGARAVAHRLHISRRRLAALEARGLRLLARQARASGCAAGADSAPGPVPVSFLLAPVAGGPAASGGVAGALYLKAPPESSPESVPPAEAIPTAPLRVTPRGSARLYWEVAAAAVAGLLLVVFVVRGDMGLGPVWRRRRRRR